MRERRRHYDRAQLLEEELPADPFELMRIWLDEAFATEALLEPHAMTLATVDAEGRPSARIVLLRDFDARGLVFFTNYESRKGQDIAAIRRLINGRTQIRQGITVFVMPHTHNDHAEENDSADCGQADNPHFPI